mmetsp:Transcript_147146/g.274063  ORF Transcript_147146/g.274063 Transcript_147146/m.274063 type:complete len:631 (-) Transcript_147146:49-1941(-)
MVEESFAGGYRRNDVVFALVDMSNSNGSVKKGAKGRVAGPSQHQKFDLLCEFPTLTGINVLASEVSLAGGFQPGCVVFSLFELCDANGSVRKGEKGKVIGSSNNEKHDLLCEFPNMSQINVWASGVSLSGGFRPGCVVFSLLEVSDERGSVRKGEKGKVLGPVKEVFSDVMSPSSVSCMLLPSTRTLDHGDLQDRQHELLCEFPSCSQINMLASAVSLAGGFRPWCVVFSLFEHLDANGSVKKGDKGKVIGPANNEKHDLLCEFPNYSRINVWARLVYLQGGFRPGCVVFSAFELSDANGTVKRGEKGKVIGPSPCEGYDLLCEFPNYSQVTVPASAVHPAGDVSKVNVKESKISVKQDPALRLAHSCQLSAGEIAEAFRSTSRGKFSITRVERVQEASLIQLVSAYLNIVEQRLIHQPIFDPQMPKNVHKQQLTSYLLSRFDTQRLAGPGLTKANVLLVWHGPSAEAAARSIAKHGFAPLSDSDPGYHGSGRYTSLESAYACMYASEYPAPKDPSSKGDWPVVLCAGVVGVAYPVTPCRDDFPEGSLPPKDPTCCLYYGAPLQTKFDTHIIPVRGPDYLAVEPRLADYHELVFREDAQLLPIALVWFKKAPSFAELASTSPPSPLQSAR